MNSVLIEAKDRRSGLRNSWAGAWYFWARF